MITSKSSWRTALLLLALLLPGLATADSRDDVLAADARRFAAMLQNDLTTLETLLADDLTYTHSNGLAESKAQFLESLRSGKLRYLAAERSDLAVRLHGDTAVVTGRAEMKVSSPGGKLELPVRFTEVWVRSGGAWRLTAWQSTRIG